MNYLTLERASKSFGEKLLFNDLSIMINKSDKAALVARNGTGKSSLLRMITGEEALEGENVYLYKNKDVRMAYLSQEPVFQKEDTLLDAILNNPFEWMSGLTNLHKAHLEHPEESYEKVLASLDQPDVWEVDTRMRELLGKFKLPPLDFPVSSLSGGQKKRLALVRILCGNPEFLILDEPTNHLDLEMIEWLERYLSQSSITLFMVTHDRYFLNNICNQIYELDQGQLYKYQGDYEEFLEKKTQRVQNESVYREKTEKLLRKELDWVRRMPKARTTKNKARVDKFYELKETIQGPQNAELAEVPLEMPRLGSKVLELHHIHKSYGDQSIVKDLSYKFKPTDRLGIVGPNGSGKTSLLNLLTGKIKPDQGKIIIGETVQFGFYEQDGLQLRDDKTVIDVVRGIADYIPLKKGHKLSAENLLERFLFPRPQQQVFVSQLSGGEKRRLYLLTILMANPNFLILDEPTNDLDIITLNVLEQYLIEFPGCVLIVSHDRYFMDKIVEHLFVLTSEGQVDDFPGNYSDFRLKSEKLIPEKTVDAVPKESSNAKVKRPGQKEKREMDQIERELDKIHQERDLLLEKFNGNVLAESEIAQINRRLAEIQLRISQLENRWEELLALSNG
ncbi:MAG: ABC-F family ATP-binding cassette domain-containing protein [Saprospiraceae bacterium]|nr:ABC-F family ATP-binding cassette domain-containing protein [Saprospiraceae bacterium]